MPSPIKPDRPQTWLTRTEMAAVFDVSLSYFDRAIRPFFESQKLVIYRANRPLFHARKCIDEWSQLNLARRRVPESNCLNIDHLMLTENLQP